MKGNKGTVEEHFELKDKNIVKSKVYGSYGQFCSLIWQNVQNYFHTISFYSVVTWLRPEDKLLENACLQLQYFFKLMKFEDLLLSVFSRPILIIFLLLLSKLSKLC